MGQLDTVVIFGMVFGFRRVPGSAGGNCSSRSLQKQISCEQGCVVSSSPLLKNTSTVTTGCIPGIGESHVTLDSIITEYLTNQHALCKNPMVPCPQFNLFE
jgi:HIV-1 Vpr-binding protein